ncbi:hypothetical protein E2562_016735 [Oryza meyeriana var. granulata]|uniref:Uncharacterized protein n=1 Tax=Oryza meyeriana var. granulata TaxID=110450 RepID=A0A6G1BWF6_9ORYZ|nr:hypothetical protein E2562_016735 [Oryza meyeriana var. granulata]
MVEPQLVEDVGLAPVALVVVAPLDQCQWAAKIRELDNLSLRDLVKRQCTARLSTRRTTETITLPRTDETAHAITPYGREGTNWVNRSSAFYNSLRNRKNKCCKPLKTHA